MESAVSRAEKRMGCSAIPSLLGEAVALTDQKMLQIRKNIEAKGGTVKK